jgi:antitoxin component of RelBE/YafQ-DinJ toxin-antitoxin module
MARDYMLRVKMDAGEYARFKELADTRGLSFSTYVRLMLQDKWMEHELAKRPESPAPRRISKKRA